MPQFSPDFDVTSKQNKKKRSSIFHKLICQCHFNGPSDGLPKSMGPGVNVPLAAVSVALRASIIKAIYKNPKPAREFEGALQHFDLQKTVYHSKLSATSPTNVICDTTERACILHSVHQNQTIFARPKMPLYYHWKAKHILKYQVKIVQ